MTSKSDVSDDDSPLSSDTEDDEEVTMLPPPPDCSVNESANEHPPKNITFKDIKDDDAKRFGCFDLFLCKLICFQCRPAHCEAHWHWHGAGHC